MNKMKEVAELLGVKIEERFNIVDAGKNHYYLSERYGLINKNGGICPQMMLELLRGDYKIEKLTFKPARSENYYCIRHDGEVNCERWENYFYDYYCYNAKNCFRTSEEITQEDIDRIVKEMKAPYEKGN